MLYIVASNGKKMHPVRYERGYRLTSVIYKEFWKRNSWVKEISKKSDYIFQQDGALAYTAKTVQGWFDANMSFWLKDFWPTQSPDLSPGIQLLDAYWVKDLQDTPQ